MGRWTRTRLATDGATDGKLKTSQKLPKKVRGKQGEFPIDKAIRLRLKGYTFEAIGKVLGCSKVNVINHLKPYSLGNTVGGNAELIRKYRADILATKSQTVLNHITDDKIKNAPANVLGPLYGILIDKERLISGQSTQNIDYSATVRRREDLQARLEELRKQRESVIKTKKSESGVFVPEE